MLTLPSIEFSLFSLLMYRLSLEFIFFYDSDYCTNISIFFRSFITIWFDWYSRCENKWGRTNADQIVLKKKDKSIFTPQISCLSKKLSELPKTRYYRKPSLLNVFARLNNLNGPPTINRHVGTWQRWLTRQVWSLMALAW